MYKAKKVKDLQVGDLFNFSGKTYLIVSQAKSMLKGKEHYMMQIIRQYDERTHQCIGESKVFHIDEYRKQITEGRMCVTLIKKK